MSTEKDNLTKNCCFRYHLVVLLASCAMVSGCAVDKPTTPKKGATKSAQRSLDLISKLVEFAQLDESSPAEKFELYFETKVHRYPHPESNKLVVFKGVDIKRDISIAGSSDVDANDPRSKQTANIRISRFSECILPELMLRKLPQLEKSPDRGPAIITDDDPVNVVFYRAYSLHNKYGYISYRFESDQCLREIGISQKTVTH